MPEQCSKTNVTIMHQPLRYTIAPYPICKEQFRYFRCGQVVLPHPSWYQAGKFTKLVATHHQHILATMFRQTSDKIHGYSVKFLGRDRWRLQQALWILIDILESLTDLATRRKTFDVYRQFRPPNTRFKCRDCLTYT